MSAARKISFDDFFAELLDKVEEINKKVDSSQAAIPPNELGIKLMKAYTAREVAEFLGVRYELVYRIPQNELPRVRRTGSGTGYLGIQVLRYMHGLDPLDTVSMVEELSESIQKTLAATTRTKVVPLNSSHSTTRLM